jgi:hypothetical protein
MLNVGVGVAQFISNQTVVAQFPNEVTSTSIFIIALGLIQLMMCGWRDTAKLQIWHHHGYGNGVISQPWLY